MKRPALTRILISSLAGGVFGFAAISQAYTASLVFILFWLGFSTVYLLQAFVEMIRTDQQQIPRICENEDLGTWIFFGLILMSCITSLAISIRYVDASELWELSPLGTKLICFVVVSCSWMIMHASFAFRYAHLFYGHQNERYRKSAGGLSFPGDAHPDYLDFAYFAFVIGMTFQVSDIVITAKPIRRLVLLHSLIAFAFNTVIIALVVSQLLSR